MMEDYRVERLSDILVERATWRDDAAPVRVADTQVNPAGAIWFRFWLVLANRVVEKYFAADGTTLGMRVPVCMPIESDGNHLRSVDLDLALWIGPEQQVTVINEEEFDAAVASGALTPLEEEYGEQAVRELTLAVAAHKFPPALIRNFETDLRKST
jgi:predicted RNA-binding protein associated with RNAse of E/G family